MNNKFLINLEEPEDDKVEEEIYSTPPVTSECKGGS